MVGFDDGGVRHGERRSLTRRAQAAAAHEVDAVHVLGTQAQHPLSQGLGGLMDRLQRIRQIHGRSGR